MIESARHVKIFWGDKMKLDSVNDRAKVIDNLLKKSFKLDEMFIHGEENNDDWIANMEILRNLISISDMIHTETIFLDTLDEMKNVHSRNTEDKEIYLSIVYENLVHFVDVLLLHLLEHSFDDLNNWEFNAEVGKKFHKEVSKKLDALIKKYQDIYDL